MREKEQKIKKYQRKSIKMLIVNITTEDINVDRDVSFIAAAFLLL
jgi:hypothetical protein